MASNSASDARTDFSKALTLIASHVSEAQQVSAYPESSKFLESIIESERSARAPRSVSGCRPSDHMCLSLAPDPSVATVASDPEVDCNGSFPFPPIAINGLAVNEYRSCIPLLFQIQYAWFLVDNPAAGIATKHEVLRPLLVSMAGARVGMIELMGRAPVPVASPVIASYCAMSGSIVESPKSAPAVAVSIARGQVQPMTVSELEASKQIADLSPTIFKLACDSTLGVVGRAAYQSLNMYERARVNAYLNKASRKRTGISSNMVWGLLQHAVLCGYPRDLISAAYNSQLLPCSIGMGPTSPVLSRAAQKADYEGLVVGFAAICMLGKNEDAEDREPDDTPAEVNIPDLPAAMKPTTAPRAPTVIGNGFKYNFNNMLANKPPGGSLDGMDEESVAGEL